MIITEENIINKLFLKKIVKEISVINFYFLEKKKIVVFIPEKEVETVFKSMSKAGAGVIGNYKNCSFRTKGTGSFFPTGNANPTKGEKGKLEFVNEVKLEMECETSNLNKVINAMLDSHPYEEVAYEIYDFKRRTNRTNGILLKFKKLIDLNESLSKINPLFRSDKIFKEKILNLGIYAREYEKTDIEELKKLKVKTAIYKSGKNYKIVKI